MNFLFYFVSTKVLYIDMNVFKSYKFDAMIYYTTTFSDNFALICRIYVQPIIFLFKMLIVVETRYWSTEFEITTFVWVIKKIRHIIETATKTTVVFIDDFANTSIAKQTTLSFSNIDKFNLKLIGIFFYLFQFDLDVRYKFDKANIVFDALFKLFTITSTKFSTNDCMWNEEFQILLIIITENLKKKSVAK